MPELPTLQVQERTCEVVNVTLLHISSFDTPYAQLCLLVQYLWASCTTKTNQEDNMRILCEQTARLA